MSMGTVFTTSVLVGHWLKEKDVKEVFSLHFHSSTPAYADYAAAYCHYCGLGLMQAVCSAVQCCVVLYLEGSTCINVKLNVIILPLRKNGQLPFLAYRG